MLVSLAVQVLLSMLVRLINKCLFLTQLSHLSPITKCFAGKAIRACAPKVLRGLDWPQLVCGSGSGPGLVLVAAWLPRVTGVRSTVLPSLLGGLSGLALIIFL